MTALLEVRRLVKEFATARGPLRAVDDVSFALEPRETLGVVGESGCGKSTLARSIMFLHRPSSGAVLLDGAPIGDASRRAMLAVRRRMQIVFQDPFGSLNPRLSIERILSEPFIVHGLGSRGQRRDWAAELVELVGLPASSLRRRPHEFSGGQRQRIGIARALALRPQVVVCDEPVSALDLSVQAQILNLLVRLQQQIGLAYVFISHDLGVVHYMADRVLVMYLGRVVELAPTEALWARPYHPYSMALLAAVGENRGRRKAVDNSEVPSPLAPPAGCHFHPRCPFAQARCQSEPPALREIAAGRWAACHFAELIAEGSGAAVAPIAAPRAVSPVAGETS